MGTKPVLAYLHGVGGVRPGWAGDLLVDQPVDSIRIAAPSYASILGDGFTETGDVGENADRDSSGAIPQVRLIDDAQRVAYLERQRQLAARAASCADVAPAGLAWPSIVPRPARWPITGILESPARFIGGLDQARRYLHDRLLRDQVLDHVGGHLAPVWDEQVGPTVLIGHSLGAVVALDLLARLDHPIDLLVTVGAPLGHPDISQRLVDRGVDLARLGGWLNVVHLLDPVPFGRGASELFPAATDVFLPVLAGGSGLSGFARGLARAATAHLDSTYLSSEVVRTVVAQALAADGAAMWSTPQGSGPSSMG